jgi:hypothetical protein
VRHPRWNKDVPHHSRGSVTDKRTGQSTPFHSSYLKYLWSQSALIAAINCFNFHFGVRFAICSFQLQG